MRDVKIIFFDAVGTLIHLPRGVGFHYAGVARRFGWKADADSLGEAFRAVWKEMPPRSSAKGPRPHDDRLWWREIVMRILNRCEPPDGMNREAYFDAVYAEFSQPGVWSLYPEVLPVLDALGSRHRLAIVSNFDGRLLVILDQLGIRSRFSDLIVSSEVGAEKPDPRIFQHALSRTGMAAQEALLVGDDLERDIAGARCAGWHAFHIDRPRMTLRDLLPTLNADPRAP